MSQRERSSLTAALAKRTLGKAEERAPAAVAESLLLGENLERAEPSVDASIQRSARPLGQPEVKPTIQPSVEPTTSSEAQLTAQPIVLPASLLKRKEKRRPRIAWTFKIPPELHEELAAVAEHNDLPMAEIVIEAITLHLRNFPHPQSGAGNVRTSR